MELQLETRRPTQPKLHQQFKTTCWSNSNCFASFFSDTFPSKFLISNVNFSFSIGIAFDEFIE